MRLASLLCCTTRTASHSGDEPPPRPIANENASSGASIDSASVKAKSTKSTSSANADLEPYTPARATALFTAYADPEDPSTIGPEGFERLCNDADIPLEGAKPLILAWLLKAAEMAKISKAEWETGMAELQIGSSAALALALSDFDDLLLANKAAPKPTHASPTKAKKAASEPYNRSRYHEAAKDRRKTFGELYVFCFNLAKPPQARLIDIETGTALWSVLLAPQYPIVDEILAFIAEKGTYKGVNKDLWQMMLEFCRTVKPTLEGYDADGAWPTMIDEFVAWKKEKLGAA
ncbi:defective in cullin neddylation 1 (DCN1)-like protein [Phanerochaete sordida]|uniref:Defective in cullin neddylation protein n=1 Tax=Phanerochaete sordida TaxID=48140 RepID=A0A9P3G5L7_9APHY|nr:defective in cullin neddylation 1 (DCN1)-like protein [Phanerochaete sordida]